MKCVALLVFVLASTPTFAQQLTRSDPAITGDAHRRAMSDLKVGRPLPGLPNLNAPVYISKLALVCPTLGALANPNIEALILTRTCVGLNGIKVSVVVPNDPETYLMAHSMSAVAIVWRSTEMSKANADYGWIKIENLKN